MTTIKLFLIVLRTIVIFTTVTTGIDTNFLFNSDHFPEPEAVPVLSNGNLGFTVFSDSVYLTGVYNGRLEQSHRARIPNYGHFQLSLCSRPETNPPHCAYQLDIKSGQFRTIYEDPNQQMRLVHSVYPHRFYGGTVVNHFRIQRLNGEGVLNVNIQRVIPTPSADITFQPVENVEIRNETIQFQCGRTNEVEDPILQPVGTQVCIYHKDYLPVLELPAGRSAEEYFFYTVFSTDEESAEIELTFLITLSNSVIEKMQEDHMKTMWDKFGVTVEGNDELDRAIKASAFQLFSSVPAIFGLHAMPKPFGISPSGVGSDGHNLWHSEMWIFPPILIADPYAAQHLLQYRTKTTRDALAENAEQEYYEGWKYPWASAFTGREVSSNPDVTRYQQHVTGDVLFAIRQYFLATEDFSWMYQEGCKVAYETARFWRHRSVYSPTTDKYGIYMATGPDDTHLYKNNNAYTNGVAAHNLFFGEYAGCLCRNDLPLKEEQWKELTKIAKSLHLPYDNTTDYIPQFDGYSEGTSIGQADAVLLGYPLELPLADSTKRRNLEIYGKATLANTSAMTWSMHAISWLDLDEMDRAAEYLHKSYQPYMRAPFNVWNERPLGYVGAKNFVSGAGGFLQSILNGYAGIRYRVDEMVIQRPRLPPETTRMFIPEINYMRAKFSLEIRSDGRFGLVAKPMILTPLLKIFVDGQEFGWCPPEESCVVFGSFNATIKIARSEVFPRTCQLKPTTLNMKLADQTPGAASRVTPMVFYILLLGYLLV